MAMNKQAHATGTDGLDVAALCRDYVHVMREAHATGEGDRVTITYVPLGEIELSALCKLYVLSVGCIFTSSSFMDCGGPVSYLLTDTMSACKPSRVRTSLPSLASRKPVQRNRPLRNKWPRWIHVAFDQSLFSTASHLAMRSASSVCAMSTQIVCTDVCVWASIVGW